MCDRLSEVLRLRPLAVVVCSAPEAVEDTYALLIRALRQLASGEPADSTAGRSWSARLDRGSFRESE